MDIVIPEALAHDFFGNVPQLMPWIGLGSMLNWWLIVFLFLRFYRKHPEALDRK